MTTVHIRHEYDTESHYLAEVPFLELDQVIPVIKAWGLSMAVDGSDEPDLYGQFVYPENRAAYFEVVIAS